MKRFYFPLIILFSTLTTHIVAQQRESYSGPYQLNDSEKGHAKFNYFLDEEGGMVKTGPFSFNKEYLKDENTFIQRDFSGKYKDGLKEGKWVYLNNTFDINIRTVTVGLQLLADLNGSRSKLEGNYREGKAHGPWKLEVQEIKDGRVVGIAQKANLNFNDGKMVGDYYFEDADEDYPLKVRGSYSEDHFFDGEWVLEYVADSIPIIERRFYDNGFLLKLELHDKQNDITLFDLEYEMVRERLSRARAGEEDLGYAIGNRRFGFLFDDGFPDFSEKEVGQSSGNEILHRVKGIIADREIEGLNLPGILELQAGGTRRFEYTYSTAEQQALENLDQDLSQYISDIQKFVNNSTLALNRQRSDSLAFTFKFLDNTLNKFIVLQENVEMLQSEEFKYQSKETFFQDGIEGIKKQDTITYTYDDEERVRVFDNEVSVRNGAGIIFNIQKYVERRQAVVDQMDPFVRQQIKEIERDMVSQQLEDEMLMIIDSVSAVYNIERGMNQMDEQGIPLRPSLIDLYEVYQRRLDSKMQEYSNVEGFENKQEIGLSILELSQIYIEAYQAVGRIPEYIETLDQAYTKLSYNPYMDRYDIATRIKRNIYFAAVDYLIPGLRNAIVHAEDFREIPSSKKDLEESVERLIEISKLPDSETRSIERRLRRETRPDRILRLLDIN
jgi:hypothetical protein